MTRIGSILPYLALMALLAPSIHAGSADAPDLTDASGDAPAPVDVLAAWWTAAPEPALTHQDVPDTGVTRVDNAVATRYPAGDRVQLVVQLGDLTAAHPILGAPGTVRYFYTITFTPSSLGAPVRVVCLLNYADTVQPPGLLPYYDNYNEVTRVGLFCAPQEDGVPGAPFAVDGTIDQLADQLRVTIIEQDVDLSPGTTLSGLTIETASGVFSTEARKFVRVAQDATDVGADYTI